MASVAMQDRSQRRTPALLGSLALHAGLLAALFIAVKTAPPLHKETEPVAVSIVASAPSLSPALQSKTVAAPRAEEPAPAVALPGPEAVKPRPAPAAAAPAPAPPVREVTPPKPAPIPKAVPPPKPSPTPTTKPALRPTPKPTPRAAPPKPQALDLNKLSESLPKAQARARSSLDLDALSGSIPAKAVRPGSGALNLDALADSLPAGGRRAGAGAKGAPRPETAPQARPAAGAGAFSGAELGALQAKLKGLWTPNCGLEGVQSIVVKISFGLGPDGRIASPPQVTSKSGNVPADVLDAAAQRAVSAVNRGQPFDELSAETLRAFGKRTVVFSKPCT